MGEIPGWNLRWKLTMDYTEENDMIVRSIVHGIYNTAAEASLEYDRQRQKSRDHLMGTTKLVGGTIEMIWERKEV